MSAAIIISAILLFCSAAVLSTSVVCDAGLEGSTCKSGSRKPLIAGNWKMNTDLSSATKLAADLVDLTKDVSSSEVDIALFPPFPFIRDIWKIAEHSPQNIKVGAQNVYFEPKGAFTGAVSASMLQSVGCEYVLVGHSERRSVFGESNEDINRNLKQVQANHMVPILCVGETLQEYELGLNKEIIATQLSKGLVGVSAADVTKIVIAYEPVWAIGTGKVATPEVAQYVHSEIRAWLRTRYGADVAAVVRILYGGSVTADTVEALMQCADIDGALVGGASLKAESFAQIVRTASKSVKKL